MKIEKVYKIDYVNYFNFLEKLKTSGYKCLDCCYGEYLSNYIILYIFLFSDKDITSYYKYDNTVYSQWAYSKDLKFIDCTRLDKLKKLL